MLQCPPAQTEKCQSNNPNHWFSPTKCETPSPLCSVVLGGGTEWLCSHVFGTTGNALGRSRTRRSASTGGSRPVSLLREITQRLEQTSLPLTNQLLMAAHPTQWERCLGEGYQPWPHCSLFLPTNTARSLILTASCF